jgi:hypothetical protein
MPMQIFSFFLLAASLRIFGFTWNVPDASDWQIAGDGSQSVLRLKTGKEPPATGPRRPAQFAVAQAGPFTKVVVEADVKPLARSLMIVFAYRDEAHFDYAHLSVDTASKQPHHNGIFHVYGGERVRISDVSGPAAFPASQDWYHVVLTHDGNSGSVDVVVDGKSVPALHAVDLSLTSGRIGLGSFDETAEFKNVKITGSGTGS